MTVDELIEWFESAKRQSPDREVGSYEVVGDVFGDVFGDLDPLVDHGNGTVKLDWDSGA